MKIGILTFTDGTNIGQRLQNYALQQILKKHCYDVYTIRQEFPFNKVKYRIKTILIRLKDPVLGVKLYKRERKFDLFNKRNIAFYQKTLSFYGDNDSFSEEFDAFIVGSDQVWNPLSPFVGDNFFLEFAKKNQRLTYAPSFSIDEIPIKQKELYNRRLCGFEKITVREEQGAIIVKELTGKDAEVVLDPTLLLERSEWDKIKKPFVNKPEGKYILAMFLGAEPEEIETVVRTMDMKLLRLSENVALGPDEFLDVVENAEIVLTDSYHITVFSILYHKPFVNFGRKGIQINMNSRFETLYKILGVTNREWGYLKEHLDEIGIMDYEIIDQKLEMERKRSKEILLCSLKTLENKTKG